MAVRLQHVSIPMPPGGNEAARAFFAGILGLQEVPVPPTLSAERLVWFKMGDTELHVFTDESPNPRSARHFCLAVDDVEALRARLEAAGVAVEHTTPIPGRPRYVCRDPFNNLIEITTIESDYLQDLDLRAANPQEQKAS